MPRAQKGQRFGGRTLGTPNKRTIYKAEQAALALASARGSNKKLATTVLDEFMHILASMAAYHQPIPAGVAVPEGRNPDEPKFLKYVELTLYAAKELAGYQQPKYSAIKVTVPGLGDELQQAPKTIDGSGNVLDYPSDAVSLARLYSQAIQPVKG